MIIRNSGLARPDEDGHLVAYSYIELYTDENTVLRLEDDEYYNFRYYEFPKNKGAFKEWVEDARKRMKDDPFLFCGDYDSETVKELIKTHKEIRQLEKKLEELYYQLSKELQDEKIKQNKEMI